MKKLLEKLKLVQHFESEVRMPADEFREKMNEKIDREPPGFFSDAFDPWSTHKNNFKGLVEKDSIVFKHRKGFFNPFISIPFIYVSFVEKGNNLEIKTKINAFKGPFMVIMLVVIIATISVLINVLLTSAGIESKNNTAEMPMVAVGLLFVFLVMGLLPYLLMRSAISSLKKKIDENLYRIESQNSFYN